MNAFKKIISVMFIAALVSSGCERGGGSDRKSGPAASPGRVVADDGKLNILCTFLPMWVLTKNVVGGRQGVTVDVLIPGSQGPHDYALTPGDVKKINNADLFVANGLYLEEFLEMVAKQARPDLEIFEAAKAIKPITVGEQGFWVSEKPAEPEKSAPADMPDCPHLKAAQEKAEPIDHNCPFAAKSEPEEKPATTDQNCPFMEQHDSQAAKDEHCSEEHDHGQEGINPHAFASPREAAMMVRAIAEKLARLDPQGAFEYKRNAEAYARRLEALANEMKAAVKAAPNKKVAFFHNAFDYLARDAGLEIVGVIETVPGQQPSAGELSRLAQTLRESGAAVVFAEPQYSTRLAEVLAKEADIKWAVLDPAATGEMDPQSYENIMRKNLETLKQNLD